MTNMREQSFYMYNEYEQGALARANRNGTFTVFIPDTDGSVKYRLDNVSRQEALDLMELGGFIY